MDEICAPIEGAAEHLAALDRSLPGNVTVEMGLALEHLATKLGGCNAVVDVRGRGMMLGVELKEPAQTQAVVRGALERGVILLPSGDGGRVLSITPPLGIEQFALLGALDILIELVNGCTPCPSP